ncbi:MAG TPA: hypothetical protein VLB80_03755, partial [Candidatus Babeliales bacterium]|nr:hypothetical protein [Candidatus Babeliales bacterium]
CERLLMTLALGGLTAEFSRWAYNESDKRTFSLLRGLKEGFSEPLRQHSPYLLKLKKSQSGYNDRDWTKAFLCEGSWGDRYTVMAKGMSKMIPGIAQANAAVCATIPTLFFDYKFGTTIVYTCRLIISMNSDLNELQRRVSAVAHGVDGLIKLRKILNHHSKELGDFFNEDDSNVDVLTKKLLSQRFLQKPGYFYSRGHVLVMHRELQHIKKSLIPMLRSVALLDAYCSLATLYKESQKEPVVFSFPKFIESPKPFVCYHNAWLPLLPFNEAITNDLVLGGDQPGKIIITGPNGGGKSTILKTYLATILAQSWCIIPAEYGEQTLFTSIKTGLAPHEDLEHGLSTFMAEKKTMSELLADITQSDENHHTLVLVDEPYKGTVDDESAKRIYQFGKDISAFDCALVAIATHVKKPIMLAYDTNGIFGNYQVKINEIYPGIFERLFKLEKGPAMWWFEDEDKRSRFIDWISVRAIS